MVYCKFKDELEQDLWKWNSTNLSVSAQIGNYLFHLKCVYVFLLPYQLCILYKIVCYVIQCKGRFLYILFIEQLISSWYHMD